MNKMIRQIAELPIEAFRYIAINLAQPCSLNERGYMLFDLGPKLGIIILMFFVSLITHPFIEDKLTRALVFLAIGLPSVIAFLYYEWYYLKNRILHAKSQKILAKIHKDSLTIQEVGIKMLPLKKSEKTTMIVREFGVENLINFFATDKPRVKLESELNSVDKSGLKKNSFILDLEYREMNIAYLLAYYQVWKIPISKKLDEHLNEVFHNEVAKKAKKMLGLKKILELLENEYIHRDDLKEALNQLIDLETFLDTDRFSRFAKSGFNLHVIKDE